MFLLTTCGTQYLATTETNFISIQLEIPEQFHYSSENPPPRWSHWLACYEEWFKANGGHQYDLRGQAAILMCYLGDQARLALYHLPTFNFEGHSTEAIKLAMTQLYEPCESSPDTISTSTSVTAISNASTMHLRIIRLLEELI